MTLVLFALVRWDLKGISQCIKPLRGLALTALISLPWYVAELLVEGQPFWDSFFGYHNLQRFTSVGEQPPPTLVVFRGDFGCGIPALHPPIAAWAGANPAPFKPEACLFICPIQRKLVSSEFCQLLASFCIAAVHHRGHEASELLDSCNACCCHSHRPCSKAFRTREPPSFGLGPGAQQSCSRLCWPWGSGVLRSGFLSSMTPKCQRCQPNCWQAAWF